ncbi:fructokinase-like 2, chloroplastic [Beta vulgaris subsp. vulgaris]|uniref:fructokinase-like 2, chloroplastic n=1 Tax=Beta vulgaris subsp. vulgaris TaxID=3555 RepID=UPI00053FC6DC|nr:fructokinase-like 2, chloroplastic [Beta vulgaris subsp. vulgaris]
MASLSFTQFLSLPRWNYRTPCVADVELMLVADNRLRNRWVLSATSKKAIVASIPEEEASTESKGTKKARSRQANARGRKKATTELLDHDFNLLASSSISEQEFSDLEASISDSEKPKRRTRKKVVSPTSTSGMEEVKTNKKSRGRKSKEEISKVEDQTSEMEVNDLEEVVYRTSQDNDDSDIDLQLGKSDGDDISFSYGWPPLVCCFGAAQHAFVPSGRPANRLIDYEIHDSLKDALWEPEKFVRAPGGSAGGVAIALASLGGRVAFMGKLGNDDYGQTMLYYLNVKNVQTRSVCVDDKRPTAVSQMKIAKRGALRTTTVKPCAEDSLSISDINIDVLKEAKMFYLNTSSLLDASMRRATLRALKISKKLGGVIFYDLNLPLSLWQSDEETKSFIEQVWSLADVIEVTKQELEFICGIKPLEEFDTKNNKRSKFEHYEPDIIAPLWHENLKVLFVTNGTSKIHYYTKEHNGAVLGVEDAPMSPFTQDMSASGDGIVAALMRMLTVQPHLITDKEYLERAVKYAINCGVIDQWIVTRQNGFPAKEGLEEEDEDEGIPDLNGIRSITERQFRTVMPVSS